MNRNLIITLIVIAVIGITIWLKPQPPGDFGQGTSVIEEARAENKVLLFADPREAESSCLCAEIIKTARTASAIQGVAFKEFDITKDAKETEKYSVHVSPTIILLDENNNEKNRLEGETKEILKRLHKELDLLKSKANSK